MQVVSLNSISDFYENFSSPYTADETCFRGVPDSTFELVPSLGRIPQLVNDMDLLISFELRIMDEFKRRISPLLGYVPKSEWEWLFIAQHYGIPTRLLDWSTNPLISLYFAVSEYPEKDFAIYQGFFDNRLYQDTDGSMKNMGVIGEQPKSVEPNSLDETYAVFPAHFDQRLQNQSAFFTSHPVPYKALEADITKYVFPHSLKQQFQTMLSAFGITKSYIYPTIDVVAKEIRDKWELELPMPSL